jgi:hypothetical protein
MYEIRRFLRKDPVALNEWDEHVVLFSQCYCNETIILTVPELKQHS